MLFDKIKEKVLEWRNANYYSDEYPELSEILKYNIIDDNNFRYLRRPQFEAIETYFYIRFILKTPHTIDIFKSLYSSSSKDLLQSLGIKHIPDEVLRYIPNIDAILEDIKENKDNIVKKYNYDTLQECLNLDYSSYILALAMGVGKTTLIASIIAIEFSIALIHENDKNVMKNALILAPDLTISKALQEIFIIPYDKILPQRFCKLFLSNVNIKKITDADKGFDGVIVGSSYNILITNTQKIIVKQKSKTNILSKINKGELLENLRLKKIKSLYNLGIFSDEAHHTYGNDMNDLKRVRETINRINKNRKIICVVNTTGTPYYEKQQLKEVIYYYGLENGIRDGILKSVENNIISYCLSNQEMEKIAVENIIKDFFNNYKYVRVNGCLAKIAFYFKELEDITKYRTIIEKTLRDINENILQILENTQNSDKKDIEEFDNLNNPNSNKRIILLCQKGKEGWNCPSLFATALIRDITKSSNFILQSSTRCLRQITENNVKAKIYLSDYNKDVLNNELKQTFNISINTLANQKVEKEEIKARLLKTNLPKIEIVKKVKTFKRKELRDNIDIKFKPVNIENEPQLFYNYSNLKNNEIYNVDTPEIIENKVKFLSIYNVSYEISTKYHLNILKIYNSLKKIYNFQIPKNHLKELFKQVEEQTKNYEEFEKEIVKTIALIKIKDDNGNYVFDRDENGYFYHTISYTKNSMREQLITKNDTNSSFGFHFDVYDFDSNPEKNFFQKIINILNEDSKNIKDIYFTGSMSDTKKTDFHFEYKGKDGKMHSYFPDFLIEKNDGTFLIVEIKSIREKGSEEVISKEKAVGQIADISNGKIKYIIIYADNNNVENNNKDYIEVCNWINK